MRPATVDPIGIEILAQLQSSDPYEQYLGVMSICDLDRPELLPSVLPLLQSRHPDLRYVAVQVIGDLGSYDSAYYGPFLVPLLESEDADMRQYSAEALGQLDYQQAIPAIERMLRKETDGEAIRFTQRALRFLKKQAVADDAVPVFRMMPVDLRRGSRKLAIVPAIH